jgi:hypothetical protein
MDPLLELPTELLEEPTELLEEPTEEECVLPPLLPEPPPQEPSAAVIKATIRSHVAFFTARNPLLGS